jgi:hypothetical protein
MPGPSAGCTQPLEQDHAPRVPRRGSAPVDGTRARRHQPAQRRRQHRAQQTSDAEQRCEHVSLREHLRQQRAHVALRRGPRHRALDELTTDVEQTSVFDTRGAGGLTRAAGQAAIEVVARRHADRTALDELLDEIDAPARTVELVARDLVGRARRETEAAVHAAAEQGLRVAPERRVLKFR